MFDIDSVYEKLENLYNKMVEKSIELGEKFPFNYAISLMNEMSKKAIEEMIEEEKHMEEVERLAAPKREEKEREYRSYINSLIEREERAKLRKKNKQEF